MIADFLGAIVAVLAFILGWVGRCLGLLLAIPLLIVGAILALPILLIVLLPVAVAGLVLYLLFRPRRGAGGERS